MMRNRLRPSLALLISALVHGGIALVLFGQANRPAGVGGSAVQAGPPLIVSLVSSARPVPRAQAAAPAKAPPEEAVSTAVHDLPDTAEAAEAEENAAAAPDARSAERHYFGAGELSEPAVVADGLAGDNVLVAPGLKPQAVSIEVWVSDEGLVDRAELETALPEAQRELVLAAFAKVRFLPGRIGRIAVHSRISLRILLDYTLRA